MASLFASNRILPSLKRRGRTPSKPDAASPSKAKPLHILPNVTEEDESSSRISCSSTNSLPLNTKQHASRHASTSATLGARPVHEARRTVVLTGVEGLTFDDFFPPSSAPRARTPSPPPRPETPPRSAAPSTASSETSLDDINLRFSGLGISLDFPSPPSTTSTFASLSRRREVSPSPSVASTDTCTTTSPKTPCSTPPTSDDDESPMRSHLKRAPTFRSQRASVLFMQSMPDLIEAPRKASITSLASNVSEEVDWIAQDIGDVFTLSTPLPPAFPSEDSDHAPDARARPDSMPPPPRARGRSSIFSKPPPPLPRISIVDSSMSLHGPSAQLDPTFPLRRRSYLVPTRPPPPPPTAPKLSEMEQATEDLLAELANAALGAGFLGVEHECPSPLSLSVPPSPSSHFIVTTPLPMTPTFGTRPPPRSSIPDDVFFGLAEVESPVEVEHAELTVPQWPTTPMSASVYSQTSAPASPLSSFDFDLEVDIDVSAVVSREEDAPVRRAPSSGSGSSERALRSRWSTSTLGSLAEASSHSWLPRFTLSPSKRGKGKTGSPSHSPSPSHAHKSSTSSTASATSPLQRKNAVKGSALKRSMESDRGVTVGRRDSRSSRMSDTASESGESTASTGSSGLVRKPIPMALLAMSAPQNSMTM
ncbi:uncharacterized protein BXZ73DRAFT_101860 [Epithele typhae]|uniref:uncharacterized protein n=1 Tax=Epithele typhae TaxID=378194 RepID=UPI002007D869|nr:uncharacterized protein BXZ73DRAFT_101860 [Epithele typhae]KAH9930488.1 hypothetical protein BXZ73DRAFT_101860 [Epithele typhae]